MATNKTTLISSACGLLLAAALTACAGGASVAQGFRVNQNQEVTVTRGMSMKQVLQVLGQPTRQIKYRNQPGPTFTYLVVGTIDTVFDVDFDATGQVMATNERVIPIDADGPFDR